MKQLLNTIRNARPDVQSLISSMVLLVRDRYTMHRRILTDNQKQFLTEHGFEFSYDERIHEWEIKLK